MTDQRRLAATVFADIAGYSRPTSLFLADSVEKLGQVVRERNV